jgi:myo-inositol-1(or 4)-monophosphatase
MSAQELEILPDLDEICDTLIGLAYKAGEIITGALPGTDTTGSKKNSMLLFSN